MTISDNLSMLQLMELHLDTLFCIDADGRLRCVNEVGEPPAPLFYFGRTLEGNLWRVRYDLPAALVDELDDLCRSEPVARDLADQPQNYEAILEVMREWLSLPHLTASRGPAYRIPEGGRGVEGAVLISAANAELVTETFAWVIPWLPEPGNGPVAAAIEQGRVVSLCFCARRPGRATEAGVHTLEGFRGKGYATAVVRAWVEEMWRLSCIPLYSTSSDNLASQAVARKVGAQLYGDDWSIK